LKKIVEYYSTYSKKAYKIYIKTLKSINGKIFDILSKKNGSDMRKFVIIIIIGLISTSLYSQKRKILYPLSLGVSIESKFGTNTVKPPIGRKTALNFAAIPDINASAYLPYSLRNNIGALVDIGLRSYNYNIEDVNYGTKYNHNFSYLTLGASLYMEGFIIGFNYGMPVSANYGESINTNKLNNMMEFRFGGTYNLYTNEVGRLNVNLLVGYMLTGIYRNAVNDDPMNSETITDELFYPTEVNNPRVASIYLGFTYYYNINY